MTGVTLERSGDRFVLSCAGHAGDPAACAAVSTLCFTLAGYLHNVPCLMIEERLEPGNARVEFVSCSQAARSAFDMICVGFLQLEAGSPAAVRVDVKGKKKNRLGTRSR